MNWSHPDPSEKSAGQSISVQDVMAMSVFLDYGVLQGSVLSPVLFLLYTSDLVDLIRTVGVGAFTSNHTLIWNFHTLFGFWLKPHLIGTMRRVDSMICLFFVLLIVLWRCFWQYVFSDTSVSEFSPSTGFFASIRVYSFSSSLSVPNSWWCSCCFFLFYCLNHLIAVQLLVLSTEDVVFDDFAPICWHSSQSGSSGINQFCSSASEPLFCISGACSTQQTCGFGIIHFWSYHWNFVSLWDLTISSDALPSTLNALTPPNFSISHQPRLSGKGIGLHLFTVHFSKRPGLLPTWRVRKAIQPSSQKIHLGGAISPPLLAVEELNWNVTCWK